MRPPRSDSNRRPFLLRLLFFYLYLGQILRMMLVANLQLAKSVLFESIDKLEPGFIVYPLEGLSKLEVLVLSHCITLTPGSTSTEISPDFRQLVVHSFGTGDPDAAVMAIKRDLEDPLLRWTR